MDNSEFVFTQSTDENGNKIFVGGGYKIDSYFLKAGQPIMTTYNNQDQQQDEDKETFLQDGGKKVTSPFENLAVPAGIFYVNQKIPKMTDIKTHYNDNDKESMLSEDIHDKLLALVQPTSHSKRNKKTKKHIPIEKVVKKRKTRHQAKK